MGTTAGGLRFPEPEDRLNQGQLAIRNLAEDVQAKVIGPGPTSLGYAVNTASLKDATTGWVNLVSVTATIPAGLAAGRRVRVTGWGHIGISVVGNVELGLFLGTATAPMIGTGNQRISNPTVGGGYFHNILASVPPPAAGAHSFHVKARNIGAGDWTTFWQAIAVELL